MANKIIITIGEVNSKLSENLSNTVGVDKPYKYTHSKLLVSRLRIAAEKMSDLSEEEQLIALRNTLIAERNIAAIAAEQYAMLNQEDIFTDLLEIVEEIDEILKV